MDENESQDPLLEFTQYRRTVKGVPMIFTVRDPSSKEDLEYRRRTQKMNYRNGKVEASDTSLDAHEWLFKQICMKVERQNGSPDSFVEIPKDEIPRKVPHRAQQTIAMLHMLELEGTETEQIKN
jgi:hypothetical protein